MMKIHRNEIVFEFVGFGEVVTDEMEGLDRLYLDVGNQLKPGVIDHHHLPAYGGSAAGLVINHPDLLEKSVNPNRKEDDPFTIVLHKDPDLDCVASAFLSVSRLATGAFPDGSEALAHYVDQVDQGYLGMSLENPFSLYSALMSLNHRLSLRVWESPEQMWQAFVHKALQVLEYVLGKVARQGTSILLVDAFSCPGLFGAQDKREIELDIKRYNAKIADPASCVRNLNLKLPNLFGGIAEVPSLIIRDVQNHGDPDRVMFFKDWARTDERRAPDGNGFVCLSVFVSESSHGSRRCIISVKPDSGVCLRGLGARLDEAETVLRIKEHGVDDRVEDPRTHEPKTPRPGYKNADPWYDGRAHNYTIVDAPRSGTRLSADDIEAILMGFGSAQNATPLHLPDLGELSESKQDSDATVRQLAALAKNCKKGQNIASEPTEPDIFISYPRAKLDWVRHQIYDPLISCRGKNSVFFDQNTLIPGAGWVKALAEAVEKCQVFLAVYCRDYFLSPFCQWELQMAITRDPCGDRQIIVPVMLEHVELPSYCILLQAFDMTREEDVASSILKIIRDPLAGAAGKTSPNRHGK